MLLQQQTAQATKMADGEVLPDSGMLRTDKSPRTYISGYIREKKSDGHEYTSVPDDFSVFG